MDSEDKEKEQLREFNNLIFKMGIPSDEAFSLSNVVGREAALEVLKIVAKDTKHRKPALFRQLARKAKSRHVKALQATKAHDAAVKGWEESRGRGFKATPEQLKAQLEELYEKGKMHDCMPWHVSKEFTELDYDSQEDILLEWGLKGIGQVLASVPTEPVEADNELPF